MTVGADSVAMARVAGLDPHQSQRLSRWFPSICARSPVRGAPAARAPADRAARLRAGGSSSAAGLLQRLLQRRGLSRHAQQVHCARHAQLAHRGDRFALEFDQQHLVRVVDLGERQRQGRRSSAGLVAADALRQVQVSESAIGDAGVEQRRRQDLRAAHHQLALRFLRHLAAAQVAVAHRDHGLARLASFARELPGAAVQLGHAGLVQGIAIPAASGPTRGRSAGRRKGSAMHQAATCPVPSLSGTISRSSGALSRPVGRASERADRSDRAGVEQRQQRSRRLDAARRVVVARRHHDGQVRHAHSGLLRSGRAAAARRPRVGVVEDVAGDQQRVDLFAFERAEQPVEEARVLVAALVLVQRLPQVPVGGVEDSHRMVIIAAGIPVAMAMDSPAMKLFHRIAFSLAALALSSQSAWSAMSPEPGGWPVVPGARLDAQAGGIASWMLENGFRIILAPVPFGRQRARRTAREDRQQARGLRRDRDGAPARAHAVQEGW